MFDRFNGTPLAVRRVLALAALVRPCFVVELVDLFATDQFGVPVRKGLIEGEINYRFLREIADNSRNNIGFFVEILFLDAAQPYGRAPSSQ